MKKLLSQIVFVTLLFLSANSAFAQIPFQTGDNQKEIDENGKKEWQKFEKKVGLELIEKYPEANVFYHPYLVVAGKTIIPDFLVKSGSSYILIEVKASKYSDLATKQDLTNNCTSNQRVAYPVINKGTTSAKVKSARSSLDGSETLSKGEGIKIKKGVLFYVNSKKNEYHSYVTRSMKK